MNDITRTGSALNLREVFLALTEQVAIRERPLIQGYPPHPMIDPHITVTLDEAKEILELVRAAQECADWHMAQASKHVTDVTLWEAVTGRDHRADS